MQRIITLGLLVIMMSFSIGCVNKEDYYKFPTRSIIDSYAIRNPKAERVDPTQIRQWFSIFEKLKKTTEFEPDLRDSTLVELFKQLKFEKYYYHYSAKANDSTLFVNYTDPLIQKSYEGNISISGIYPHDQVFIFHSNGNIEIRLGNQVSLEKDTSNDGTFRKVLIDGKTGLILNYWEEDQVSWSNYLRLNQDGIMEKGENYKNHAPNATSTVELLSDRMKAINEKLATIKN